MSAKFNAITVEPLNKAKKASLNVKGGNVGFSGWCFNLQERPGGIDDYKEESALAVLDYLSSKLRSVVKNKTLLPESESVSLTTPQLEFEAERMACLAINIAAGKE